MADRHARGLWVAASVVAVLAAVAFLHLVVYKRHLWEGTYLTGGYVSRQRTRAMRGAILALLLAVIAIGVAHAF